jgi:hypothetical protein
MSGRPDLGFLGTSPFCSKDPNFGGWNSLDFLGFSRADLDLSIGYEGKSRKVFSSRFCRRKQPSKHLAHDSAAAGTNCSWDKLNSISDFLQDIAALAALAVAVAAHRLLFGFFVMAGLDPAIHEDTESCNQGNDNVT